MPVALQLTDEEIGKESDWKIEAAKIERFLGISPDAGIDFAIKLASSDVWQDRMLAAKILGDIPTEKARDYLRTLSQDSEAYVVAAARRALPFRPAARLDVRKVSFKELNSAANP